MVSNIILKPKFLKSQNQDYKKDLPKNTAKVAVK
jgi:hypothetical protein